MRLKHQNAAFAKNAPRCFNKLAVTLAGAMKQCPLQCRIAHHCATGLQKLLIPQGALHHRTLAPIHDPLNEIADRELDRNAHNVIARCILALIPLIMRKPRLGAT